MNMLAVPYTFSERPAICFQAKIYISLRFALFQSLKICSKISTCTTGCVVDYRKSPRALGVSGSVRVNHPSNPYIRVLSMHLATRVSDEATSGAAAFIRQSVVN